MKILLAGVACIVSFGPTVGALQAAPDIVIGHFRSRCVVPKVGASVMSVAKAMFAVDKRDKRNGGISETIIAPTVDDCSRLRAYSWGIPAITFDDRIYDRRRAMLIRANIVAARVLRDAEGRSVNVRSGRHIRSESVGRRPDEFVIGKTVCKLLQVSGGQDTEARGTMQVMVFVVCDHPKLRATEAEELVSAIRSRTGVGSSSVTAMTMMVNRCAQFRELAFPAWYAFEEDGESDECDSSWKSMIFSWKGQMCITNEDGRTCTPAE